MEEKWLVRAKKADFRGLGQKFGLDPVTIRLMRNRDVFTDQDSEILPDGRSLAEHRIDRFLHGTLEDLHDPAGLKDIDRAASIILTAIRENRKIRIIGDYDIDGIMSSYILLTGLRKLGAQADVRIPDRVRDGYGLNENLVRAAAADGIDLIVTCDNGIAAAGQIRLAYELGMEAVVTDHHQVPFTDHESGYEPAPGALFEGLADGTVREYLLPPAGAVIDPHRADDTYPFPDICGAVVAWKLILYLFRLARPEEEQEERDRLLEFAAIATVGDIMDLRDENRIIVREGLKNLRRTTNPGLSELIRQNNLDRNRIDVYHIGFVIGPCLNASGRLDTAMDALQMLLEQDEEKAAKRAGDLIALNQSRKAMTQKGADEAVELVEHSDLKKDRVLVVYLPDCHESIAGIVAGRLKEHYNRPAFVITKTTDGAKGSGRSIETYSMYEELVKVSHLLTKFGGHPMAAGISLPLENVDAFRKEINACCTLTEDDLTRRVMIDIPMPVSYVRQDLIRELDVLKPFGKGNEKPVFAESGLQVLSPRVFGKNRNVCKMRLSEAGGATISAVYFGDADAFISYAQSHDRISVTYFPEIDTWNGRMSLQAVISSYR